MWYEDDDNPGNPWSTLELDKIDQDDRKRVAGYLADDGHDTFWHFADAGCYTANEKFWAIVDQR